LAARRNESRQVNGTARISVREPSL
jgi:hypothetical protein